MKNCVGNSIRAPCTLTGTFEDNAHTSVYPVRHLRPRRDSYTNTLRELYNGVFTLGSVRLVSRRDNTPEASCKPSASDSADGLSLCVDTSDAGCSGARFLATGYSISCQGPDATSATVYCGARDQNLASNRHNFLRPARTSGSVGTPLIPANVSDAPQKFRASGLVGIPGLPHPTIPLVVAIVPRAKTSSNAYVQPKFMNCASAVIISVA